MVWQHFLKHIGLSWTRMTFCNMLSSELKYSAQIVQIASKHALNTLWQHTWAKWDFQVRASPRKSAQVRANNCLGIFSSIYGQQNASKSVQFFGLATIADPSLNIAI